MIRTSHVGSFPLPYSVDNLERILIDLCSIGLDAPPYPQLRSFIDIYLEPLRDQGVLVKKGDFYFLSSRDKLDLLEEYEPRIHEAEYTVEYIRGRRMGFKWLRAPVTGAFTLASRIYLEPDIGKGLNATAITDRKLVEKLSLYVRRHLEYMSRLGYNILFIDDPVLGVIVGRRRILFNYADEDIKTIINTLFEKLPGEHGIHVCGRISPRLFNLLAEIDNLNILNFEFHDNPKNIDVINREILESNNKILAPGIASAKKPVVESIDELLKLLLTITDKAGGRIDLVSADCGFGGLAVEDGDPVKAYRIGLAKLRNIVKVVRQLNNK